MHQVLERLLERPRHHDLSRMEYCSVRALNRAGARHDREPEAFIALRGDVRPRQRPFERSYQSPLTSQTELSRCCLAEQTNVGIDTQALKASFERGARLHAIRGKPAERLARGLGGHDVCGGYRPIQTFRRVARNTPAVGSALAPL